MNALRRLAAALAFATAALPAAAAGADATGETRNPQLLVDVPAVSFSRDRLAIVVEQRDGLAGRKLMVTVHLDNGLIDGFPTGGRKTPIAVEGLELEPGRHRLMVRSGTHFARSTFLYVPAAWAAGAAALLTAAVAGTIYLRRRKGTA